LPEFCGVDHKIYLYADDAKLYNTITSKKDQLDNKKAVFIHFSKLSFDHSQYSVRNGFSFRALS